MGTDKIILDVTAGARMMWFDKEHPDVFYADKRCEEHLLSDGRVLEIKPDGLVDFTAMPFDDDSFKLVVFDPPHLKKIGTNSDMAKKYGQLFPTWETDIKAGFDECMRVLQPYGILIFKWNSYQIKVDSILELIEYKPLFGHRSGKSSLTIWMTFMKTPDHD